MTGDQISSRCVCFLLHCYQIAIIDFRSLGYRVVVGLANKQRCSSRLNCAQQDPWRLGLARCNGVKVSVTHQLYFLIYSVPFHGLGHKTDGETARSRDPSGVGYSASELLPIPCLYFAFIFVPFLLRSLRISQYTAKEPR